MKVHGGVQSCVVLLKAYRRMFPSNLITNGLPKPDALQSANHVIIESHTDGTLQAHWTVILKVAYYKTGRLRPIMFFIIDTKIGVIISHMPIIHLRLLSVK